MHYLLKCVSVSILCVMALGCVQEQRDETSVQGELPEGFNDFYVRFHRDTSFQMTHISWPLQGVKNGMSNDNTSFWTRAEWRPHTRIPSAMEYDQRFNVLSDDLVVETIKDKAAPYGMQRRFARTSGGWNMIFYVEMQPIRQESSN